MEILITGDTKEMVATSLINNLKATKDEKNKIRLNLITNETFEYYIDNTKDNLDYFCPEADFVFNLAGVNRATNPDKFKKGNFGFA